MNLHICLGTKDTYEDFDKKNKPNLMNTLGKINNGKLDDDQMNQEVWQGTLGPWNFIWGAFQNGQYSRALGSKENENSKDQLIKFIKENGEAEKVNP